MNGPTSVARRFAACPTRREVVAGGAAALASGAWAQAVRAPPDALAPEMFGAKGDGRTNDTAAFAALSAHLNARGGGTIILRPATYVVGTQRRSQGNRQSSFEPLDIIHLVRCNLPISIQGNGARLRSAQGLRYGRFNPDTGTPLPDSIKLDQSGQAIPYMAMINIEHCTGSVEIRDIELDGNLATMLVGGRSFRNGWEAFGYGLRLVGNRGSESLSNIRSHHQPLDGLLIAPSTQRVGSTTITELVCDSNGRQGCTVGDGRNIHFIGCAFTRTGRAGLGAAPGSGVDIETGVGHIRDVTFSHCEFSDNLGFGLDAGSGDSAGISFSSCTFIGTTNYSAWPDRPQMRFTACWFVGALNHIYGDPDRDRAAQFSNCTFTDDPSLSPTGKVFLPGGKWIAVVLQRPNVLFSGCRFRLVRRAILPLSDSRVIYSNCEMSQASPSASGPSGTYVGTNSIVGNAYLTGSKIRGKLILNGRVVPQTV